MKLTIDNLDGRGAQDYTAFLDAGRSPRVLRKLNRPAELQFSLVTGEGDFVVPVTGARVTLGRSNGSDVFTGYVARTPAYQYLGWTEKGPLYRYEVVALSDAMMLDQKAPPPHPPFVARSAGDALRQLSQDALPGWFDCSGVEAGDSIPYYSVDPAKKWSAAAAEIGLVGRCSYRDDNGKLLFAPLAANTYALAENGAGFSPGHLELRSVNRLVNDLTILGELEPSAHVKDYFVGDGYTSRFYLSQVPFTRGDAVPLYNRTILNEEYAELDATRWAVTDPQHAISVSGGKLQVAGGTGVGGQTVLDFIEKIELGGATVLQHGDAVFNAPSNGVIGGLYAGTVSTAGCLAGFRITPAGANSNIQALIGGSVTGTVLGTQAGHHYVFTTRLYGTEVYRLQQAFHSSLHPAGSARGGNAVACDIRVVLEVHDIDPADPGTQVAPATVLYDGVITNAPGFCTYAPINARSMQCSVAFTDIWLAVDVLVRSTLPEQSPRTRRTGSLREGAECYVSNLELAFYPEYVPASNETIEVTYRSRGHARARVSDPASIAAHQRGLDDGVRGAVRQIGMPAPRTAADCETAALAMLDDGGAGWTGEYQAWSSFLPGGAADIFPGDGLAVDVPSRGASFSAIVREVDVALLDLAGENSRYTLRFVDAGDPSLDFAFATAAVKQASVLAATPGDKVGNICLPDLTGAEVTAVTSTTVSVDAGFTPGAGQGIEVRYSDTAWGRGNDRNLIGRFTVRSFTVPRYGRGQDYFLRRYDSSSPPKYSRYSAALCVSYPL